MSRELPSNLTNFGSYGNRGITGTNGMKRGSQSVFSNLLGVAVVTPFFMNEILSKYPSIKKETLCN